MRKYAYLAKLEELLAALSAQERQEALNYYEEYFDAAGSENEEKTARELGDPAEVARKILEGEGIDPDAVQVQAPAESSQKGSATGAPLPQTAEEVIRQPAGPEPPPLEAPDDYPTQGITEKAVPKKRRLWVIYWLLVVLAIVIQISVLQFGLHGKRTYGGETAFMAVSAAASEADKPAVTPIPTEPAGLDAAGMVTYSGTLETPGRGTLFVNLTHGNVAFRTGDKATVEVRNVDVKNNVSYGQTVDYGYSFVCESADPNTHVTITLPPDAYDKLEVHIAISGAIELGDLQIEEITAYTASGPIQSGEICVRNLDVKTDIGNIWMERISDGAGYRTEDVTLQAPSGYVAAKFRAARDEWESEILAPDGLSETGAPETMDQKVVRKLHVEAGNTANVQYGVQ